jgi:hypothetical protein
MAVRAPVVLCLEGPGGGGAFPRADEREVVQFEGEQRVEDGEEPFARRGARSDRRGAGLDGLAQGGHPGVNSASSSPSRLPKARKTVPLPTPAAAATSSMDTVCGASVPANSASAAASTRERGTGGRPRRAR